MEKNTQRIFILGIDGATFDVINPLLRMGRLPNMEKVIRYGVHGNLQSTIPSLSAPAWVTFMTGRNVGHYGSYHFRKINIKEYENIYSQSLINSSFFSGTTFFDYLGSKGYKIGVMTVPVTYPPWEVNGYLVSGYPCPDPSDYPNYTFPHILAEELPENLNWTENDNSDRIHKSEARGTNNPQDILDGGLAMMSRRTDYTLKLMKQYDSDVTVLVWGEIDRAQHKVWNYHDPEYVSYSPDNPYKDYINRLYCHADHLLGVILGHLSKDTYLFIVSDHGFGPRQGFSFNLNTWLHKHGYLKVGLRSRVLNNFLIKALKNPVRNLVMKQGVSTRRKIGQVRDKLMIGGIDFKQTKAYRFPIDDQTEGIVVNLEGRQHHGCVKKGDYEPLRTKLIEQLLRLKDDRNGNPIIKECFRREDLYQGEKVIEAPDIICVLQEGYISGSGLSGRIIEDIPEFYLKIASGTHRSKGIFIAHGPDILKGMTCDQAHIMDVAPTVIYALGEKIPKDLEGKVISSIFSTKRLHIPPDYTDYKLSIKKGGRDVSSSEEEMMKNKLKDLGYL